MSIGLNDIASAFCKDDCKDGKKNNNVFLLVLIVLIFCFCGNGSSFGGYGCSPCDKPRGESNGGTLIIILIILVVLCGNKGFGGFGGQSGNLNTNIINVERDEDYYDDY